MSAAKTIGLVGRKAGMTRVFNDAGEAVPVTVIEALPNRITQVRTVEPTAIARCRSLSATARPPISASRRPAITPRSRSLPGSRWSSSACPARKARTWRRAPSSRSTCSRRPDRGCHRHDHRQGLRRRHEAPQLRRHGGRTASPCRTARQAPSASARRRAACSPASAWRAAWAMAPHDREPQDRPRGPRAQPAAGQRRGAGCTGRPGGRPSVGEGRGPRTRKKIAPVKK